MTKVPSTHHTSCQQRQCAQLLINKYSKHPPKRSFAPYNRLLRGSGWSLDVVLAAIRKYTDTAQVRGGCSRCMYEALLVNVDVKAASVQCDDAL